MGSSARGTSLVGSAPRAWTGTSAQSRRFTGFEIRDIANPERAALTDALGWGRATER